MKIEKGPGKCIQVESLAEKAGIARKYVENQKSLDLWNSSKDLLQEWSC